MILTSIRKAIGYPFLIIHFIVYHQLPRAKKSLIDSDITEMNRRLKKDESLLFYLLFYKYYRNLFYSRVEGLISKIMALYIKPVDSFTIKTENGMGGAMYVLNHPFGTIIHAERIGDNFTCCSLTTVGNGRHGRNDLLPTIGNNVSLGVNVSIIGKVTIGNNVIVGAGSVVVKDVPSNCIVAGNPAQVIRYLSEK